MNRMKGKKILAALGFFSIAGVAGGCSQPAPNIRYQIETDQPCQTMAYLVLPMPGVCNSSGFGRRRNKTK